MTCHGDGTGTTLGRSDALTPEQVQSVAFEIALLGQRCIDVNEPTPKYTLRSLPGTISDLHLMALMYTGFKPVAPCQPTQRPCIGQLT